MQLTKKTLGGIVARLKSGKTTLGQESKALGMSGNGGLRKALVEHLGSKQEYNELMTKSREKRPSTTRVNRVKNRHHQQQAPKKTAAEDEPPDNEDNEDSSDDEAPEDVCTLMDQGEERREELEQNGTAGADAEQLVSVI